MRRGLDDTFRESLSAVDTGSGRCGAVHDPVGLVRLRRRHPAFTFHVLVTEAPSRFCAKRQYMPEWLREHYPSLVGHRAVIGGSPGFVQASADTCVALGMAADAIATDSFTPVRT